MEQKRSRRKNRMAVGDVYRLTLAVSGWALFAVAFFSSSSMSRNRAAVYGTGCLLAAYTLFTLAIWRKQSR